MRISLRRIVRAGLVVVVVLGVALAEVGVSAAREPAGKKSRRGGTFTMVVGNEPRAFDPLQATGVAVVGDPWHQYAVYDVLAYPDIDRAGLIVPKTAKSFTSTDGIVWTVTLRSGIKFTDGTDYDAEAVKFNWERIANPDNASTQGPAARTIESMRVVDKLTLEVTLVAPNGAFPVLVATVIPYIASPTAIRKYGDEYGLSTDTTVGAGPFVLTDWVRGSSATFERNTNYWKKGKKGKPYLDELVISVIPDAVQRLNTILSGGAQGLAGPVTLQPAQVDQAESAGLKAYVEPPPTFSGQFGIMNMTVAPFDDVRVRKAVQQSLDWKAFNDVVNSGAPFELDYHVLRKPSPFFEKDLTMPKYDPVKAQELFDEYFASTGNEVEIYFRWTSSVDNWGQFVLTQLGRYDHVNVTPDTFAAPQIGLIYGRKQYGLAFTALIGYDPEPTIFDWQHSSGTRPFMGYGSPDMDAALERAHRATTVKDRKAAYREVQQIMIRDQIGLFNPVVSELPRILVAKGVKGFRVTLGNARWERVWLKRA